MPGLCSAMPFAIAPMPCSRTPKRRLRSCAESFWKSPNCFISVMLLGARSALPPQKPEQAVHHTGQAKVGPGTPAGCRPSGWAIFATTPGLAHQKSRVHTLPLRMPLSNQERSGQPVQQQSNGGAGRH